MLSGNTLKIIAAVCMLIDHIGVILLPDAKILRIVGRLAYPIFAYMISEGCCYTRNLKRYILKIALVAIVCQLVYYMYNRSLEMCILVTFCMSVIVISALMRLRRASSLEDRCFRLIELCFAVAAVYVINLYFKIDYGFCGCMAPVFACLFDRDKVLYNVLAFGIGLTVLAVDYGGIQWYSLLSLPLLAMYSGRRGKLNMKYFFYIFYPLHLAVLELVNVII